MPAELHDKFNDYPLAPENCMGEFSPLMREIAEQHDIHINGQVSKLI